MSPDEIRAMSKTEFDTAFANDRLFTVKDAIDYLSKCNPNAGLFVFNSDMNAWVDMSADMLRTAEIERKRSEKRLLHYFRLYDSADEKTNETISE